MKNTKMTKNKAYTNKPKKHMQMKWNEIVSYRIAAMIISTMKVNADRAIDIQPLFFPLFVYTTLGII